MRLVTSSPRLAIILRRISDHGTGISFAEGCWQDYFSSIPVPHLNSACSETVTKRKIATKHLPAVVHWYRTPAVFEEEQAMLPNADHSEDP
ncbi:MAG: hypothetical protein DMG62_00295, partial [Acidobacteria bacterium]